MSAQLEEVLREPSANVEERCGRLCECRKCGVIATCTPLFDFYGTVPGEGFTCEACICGYPPGHAAERMARGDS